MNLSPAKDLSKHFQHRTILASAGISVKGEVPELTRCPFCGHEELSIQSDPMIIGGHWFYCRACFFKGDSLELFSRLRGIDDLHEAVAKGISEGYCTLPSSEMNSDLVNSYISNYPMRRRSSDKLWETLHAKMLERSPDLSQRSQLDHLYSGWSFRGRVRMSQFLGGGTAKEINRLFMAIDHTGRVIPEGQDFRVSLALNYQDAPGRICAFKFLGENGKEIFKYWSDATNRMNEGGLAMLETVNIRDGTIFALGSHEMALHLQRKWLTNFEEPLKIVVFNDSTRLAWQSVLANQVIFWDKEITWKIFAQARLVANSEISGDPCFKTDIFEYVRDTSPSACLDVMRKHAKPWREAFVKWIANRQLPEYKAREAVARLNFDTHERRSLHDACPVELKTRFDNIMGEIVVMNTAVVNGTAVVEQNDGWWTNKMRSGKELICDAIVKIHYEISDQKTGEVTWQGIVRFKGTNIPFREKHSVIVENPERWMSKLLAQASMGTPYVLPRWRAYIVNLAKMFSQPKLVASQTQLGINNHGEIVFPHFRIIGGKVVKEDMSFRAIDAPALDVVPPVDRVVSASDVYFPARSAFMALTAAFVANLMSSMKGELPRSILAVGQHNACARSVAQHFAKISGMKNFTLQSGREYEVTRLRGKFAEYPYPSYLETKSSSMLHSYPATAMDNVLIPTDQLEAALLAINGNYVMIQAARVREDRFTLPPFDDVLLYLKSIQLRSFQLQDNVSVEDAVLFDLCNWYADRFKTNEDETYSEAKRMLRAAVSPGDAMVEAVCWLIRMGRAEIIRTNNLSADYIRTKAIKREHNLYIDDVTERVFVPKGIFNKALLMRHFPQPDLSIPAEDLVRRKLILDEEMCSFGWLLSKSYWEEVSKTWSSIKSI